MLGGRNANLCLGLLKRGPPFSGDSERKSDELEAIVSADSTGHSVTFQRSFHEESGLVQEFCFFLAI